MRFALWACRLILGRYFTAYDNEKAPLVCVVDTTLAQTEWPGGGRIGNV